jgi:hypothetical protein
MAGGGFALDLGFLGPRPFPYESPRLWVLDCLGFPWILSSESRLFNGLRDQKRGSFFLGAFPRRLKGERTGARNLGRRKRGIAHRTSLSQFLIFCKIWLSPYGVHRPEFGRTGALIRSIGPPPGPRPGAGSSPRGRRASAASAVRRLGSRRAPRRGKPVRPAPLEPIEHAIAEAPQRRDVVGQKHKA